MRRFRSALIVLIVLAAVRLYGQGAVCGNSVRDPGEQCDDGNTNNMDGCSAQCQFEQVQRINQLKQQFTTSTACTHNAFGQAFGSGTVQSQIQTSLDAAVADGSLSILFPMIGLNDLSGTFGTVDLGIMQALPVRTGGYDGTNDLDWWYVAAAGDLDVSRLPTQRLAGSIAGKILTAGPGHAALPVVLAGAPAELAFSSLTVTATNGTSTAPAIALTDQPPGYTADKHLDPILTSYATSGASITGQLCGNVSAASFRNIPIPSSLTGGGLTACTQNYSASNSFLDLMVGGCTIFIVQAVAPTQPDQVDPSAPVAGGGGLYKLSANASKAVDTCRDKNNAVVNLDMCLDAAAYSEYFKFSTDRIVLRPCPDAPSASNDGPVCPNDTLHLTAAGPFYGNYFWTGPNGFTSTQQHATIPNVTTAATGTYTVTVTVGGCTSPAATTDVVVIDGTPNTLAISAPATVAPNASGLVASVPLHNSSTYAWSITNGSITGGATTNQITFTAGVSGDVELNVTETFTSCSESGSTVIPVIPIAPQAFSATAYQTDQDIRLLWNPSDGAASYKIFRRSKLDGALAEFDTAPGPPYDDVTVNGGDAYLYAVQAVGGTGHVSPLSTIDLAAAVIFDPVTPGSSVNATSVTQLRTAVTGIENLAHVSPTTTYDDPVLDSTVAVRAVHIDQLRTALDNARGLLGFSPLSYTNTTIGANTSTIQAADIIDLQNGAK